MPDVMTDSLVVRSLGWALLQFVWQGAVVGLLTATTLGLLHRRTAATRYLVASAGLLIMFLLPVASSIYHARHLSAASVSTSPTTSSSVAGPHVIDRPLSTPDVRPATDRPRFTSPVSRLSETWQPAAVLVWLAGVVALSMRLLAGWFVGRTRVRRLLRI